MTHNQQRRAWKTLVVIAIAFGLLLLLLPHSPAFHDGLTACFVLLPVLLFGIIESSDPVLPGKENPLAFYQAPIRSALFQRPPPPVLA